MKINEAIAYASRHSIRVGYDEIDFVPGRTYFVMRSIRIMHHRQEKFQITINQVNSARRSWIPEGQDTPMSRGRAIEWAADEIIRMRKAVTFVRAA